MVDFDGVVVLHYASVIQLLMDLVLSKCMLYVVILDLIAPTVVEVMDLAGYFATVL